MNKWVEMVDHDIDDTYELTIDVINNFPKEGYYGAFIDGHDDITGIARSDNKAIAFALEQLAEKIKHKDHIL